MSTFLEKDTTLYIHQQDSKRAAQGPAAGEHLAERRTDTGCLWPRCVNRIIIYRKPPIYPAAAEQPKYKRLMHPTDGIVFDSETGHHMEHGPKGTRHERAWS